KDEIICSVFVSDSYPGMVASTIPNAINASGFVVPFIEAIHQLRCTASVCPSRRAASAIALDISNRLGEEATAAFLRNSAARERSRGETPATARITGAGA